MNAWTRAALELMTLALATGLIGSGIALARAKPLRSSDYDRWLIAAIMLVLISAADRLTLLDGQLLGLAALLLLWWGASRRGDVARGEAEPRTSMVSFFGLLLLLVATAGLGGIAIAKVSAGFISALRSAPGGYASLSWFDMLLILAEVARSRPSLGGLGALAPIAWITAATAVVLLWITVLPPVWKRGVGRAAGVAMLLAGIWVAARVKMR